MSVGISYQYDEYGETSCQGKPTSVYNWNSTNSCNAVSNMPIGTQSDGYWSYTCNN